MLCSPYLSDSCLGQSSCRFGRRFPQLLYAQPRRRHHHRGSSCRLDHHSSCGGHGRHHDVFDGRKGIEKGTLVVSFSPKRRRLGRLDERAKRNGIMSSEMSILSPSSASGPASDRGVTPILITYLVLEVLPDPKGAEAKLSWAVRVSGPHFYYLIPECMHKAHSF